jgi:50S ribosomal protein L16 3-hydroxylase
MDIDAPQALLGGLSPARFMRRHWQKRPLLVRRAWPGVRPPLPRARLLALAAAEGVESRLVLRGEAGWTLRHGPMPRRALPPVGRPGWTLLVQGLDLHVPAARAMLDRFRFVPEARLDDLMLSYATDQGGVGPHLDSYDVFLLQVHGRRRWRIAPPGDDALVEGLPLKILRRFEPQQEWVLEPGDLLYLPPRWGHDGVAEGECMTCSVGFRAPTAPALAGELLARLADIDPGVDAGAAPVLYRDTAQPATGQPGRIPPALQGFARRAVERALGARDALELALGETLTEPKAHVWFAPGAADALQPGRGVALAARSRMMYDDRHVYINGESFRASGLDGRLMRELADRRMLPAEGLRRLSPEARSLLQDWLRAGWLLAVSPDETPGP